MFKRFFYVGVSVFVVIGVGFLFYQGFNFFLSDYFKSNQVLAVFDDKEVTASTVVRQEHSYLCQDVELNYLGLAKDLFANSDKKTLEDEYLKSGYEIEYLEDNTLLMTKEVDDFCAIHKKYRHLGIHENKLAIYEGSLGFDENLLWVEDKLINSLPQEIQLSLEKAKDYSNLSEEEKKDCQINLEFENEEKLNNMLENLDELD